MASDNGWGQIFVINNLSLKLKIILIVSLLAVEAWSSQLTQLADLKDSSCKEALSKNADLENSEIEEIVKKITNVRPKKSKKIEYLVNEFNKISPSHLRSEKGYIYPQNARDIAVRLVEVSEGNVTAAARALGIARSTVRKWALDYQDRTGEQIINTKKRGEYSHEFKSKAIKQVEKTNGDVLAVSKQLNMSSFLLTNWLVKYELENEGSLKIIDPDSGKRMDFEDKMLAAMIVDEDYEGNVKKAAEDLGYIPQILNVWVQVYEKKTGKRVRKKRTLTRLFDEEKSLALEVLKEEGNVTKVAELLDVGRETLRRMDEGHYNETGERLRNTNPNRGNRYDDEIKAYAVKIVIEHKGNVAAATRQLNEEGIKVSKQTVHEWVKKYEQETGEKILNTDNRYDDDTKAYAIKMVKKHKGNVLAATRALNKEGINVSVWTVREWVIKHEQETGEKVLNTNPYKGNRYDDDTKAYAIKMVKKHKGNVAVAVRELKKEGINVSVSTVHRWWNEYKQTAEGNH